MLEIFGIPIGTLAQVGTFGLVFIALVGAYVKLRDRGMTHAEVMCGQLTTEVNNLRDRLIKCETDCREETQSLHEKIFGMRKQAVAEQISFINVLMRSVDSPDLQLMRTTLERVQMGLEVSRKATENEEGNDVAGA